MIAVFIVDLLRAYGSEQSTVQLVNGLAQKGCAVDLLVQVPGGTITQNIDPRVRQIVIGTRSPWKTVTFLYRYLKRNNPRVLFTRMEKPSLLGIVAGMLAGYKNIVPSIHFDIDAYAQNEYATRRKILRLLVAVFYRYAASVVAVSTGANMALQRWIGNKTPVKTILNGFDIDKLRTFSKENVTFPWLTHKDKPVFISCGRLVPLKGFDILLKAFAMLLETDDARLILLGEGDLRPQLQDLAVDLGITHDFAMPGFVAKPISWFALSDCFVMTSRTEGFGNVLVEALVTGIEIISTDCPSGPAEILDNGTFGQLVPVDNVEALANAMREALRRCREKTTSTAKVRSYVDAQFSLDTMVQSYLNIADSLNDDQATEKVA